ncbi:hypothetical protein ACFQL9_13090 [Halobaculum lipolyticum]|uniref:Uncharacterized protein n=1 Tax=Halobaculum lipolyticum TaxID=3032001 RepID=A0ABD5WBD4_9EURY
MEPTQLLPSVGLLYWFAIFSIADCVRKFERYFVGASGVAYKSSITKLGWGLATVGLLYLFDSPRVVLREVSHFPLVGWLESLWFPEIVSTIAPLHHLFYFPLLVVVFLGVGIMGSFVLRAIGAVVISAGRAFKIRQQTVLPVVYVFPRLVVPELLYILDRHLTFLRYGTRHSIERTTIARRISTRRDRGGLVVPERTGPFVLLSTLEGLAVLALVVRFLFNNYSAAPALALGVWSSVVASVTGVLQAYASIPLIVPIGMLLLVWGLIPFLRGEADTSVFAELPVAIVGTGVLLLLFPILNITHVFDRLPTVYSTLDYIPVVAFVVSVWELSLRLLDPEAI